MAKKAIQEFKMSVRGLERGLYVSRLDRPWVETPFPLQGLLLQTEAEIQQLQRVCSHVYVDVSVGRSPDPRYLEFGGSELVHRVRGQEQIAELRRTDWQIETDFETELRLAQGAHETLEENIQEVMGDLRDGRHLDLNKLREGVDAMIGSITRNPSAFGWLLEIKRRDNYAYQHAMSCAIWAASFGRHLGLERPELRDVALGGLLCDVGKTRLPIELLSKRAALTEDEAQLVRRHVEHSLEIVHATPGLHPKIIEMVATHHERHDGSGYPRGLRGNEIPIFGRVMGLVDSYDAMTSTRPYAKSRSPHQAVNELYDYRDRLFQGELVEQFIQTCGIYPTGSLVELSDGRVGVVTAVHSLRRLRPSVMLLLDENKQPMKLFVSIDLTEVEIDHNGNPLAVKSGLPSGAFGIDPEELFLT